MALQNTRRPPLLSERPIDTEISDEQSQSRKHRRATSPTPLESSDDELSLPLPVRRINMIILGGRPRSSSLSKILISLYKRGEDATSWQVQSHHSRCINSPLGILEYEFSKKFMILTSDCYSAQSDPVQHLRQY